MFEQKLRKRRWRKILQVSWKSSLVSGLIVLTINALDGLDGPALHSGAFGAIAGFLVPLALLSVLLMAMPRGFLRRLPYLASVGLSVLLLLLLSLGIYLALGAALLPGDPLATGGLLMAIGIGLLLSVVFTAATTIQQFLGPSFASDLILGRYHQPREGERVFAFVDLKDSTRLGEELGHRRFFALINDYLALVEQCAELYDGRVYKYLGDGAILIWPVERAFAALECLTELTAAIEQRQPRFEKRYGSRIEFTAGLHEGRVLIGEIGDERREIGYLGDALNSTARIQSHCKTLGVSILLSEAVASRAEGQQPRVVAGLELERHEGVMLRGRNEPITLVAIHPSPAPGVDPSRPSPGPEAKRPPQEAASTP